MVKGKKIELTQNELKELFNYKDGGLYWKINRGINKLIDKRVGYLDSGRYRIVGINGRNYREHRLIYKWHYGYCPPELDHINRNPSDNRIENLRPATRSQNLMNQKIKKGCSSKHKGVSWYKQRKVWVARIKKDGKTYHLGQYINEERAAFVYNEAAKRLYGEFAYLNEIEQTYKEMTEKELKELFNYKDRCSSKHKGVSWNKIHKKWQVSIQKDGKHYYLGYFHNEEEAAHAYNIAAKKLFGEFANLNEIEQKYQNQNLEEWMMKNEEPLLDLDNLSPKKNQFQGLGKWMV